MEDEYRKYREELAALHAKYKFSRKDRVGTIPKDIRNKRRHLSKLVYEHAQKEWRAVPEDIQAELWKDVDRAMKRAKQLERTDDEELS